MTKTRLLEEIGQELEQLEKLSCVASDLLAVLAAERKPWHAAAAGK